MPDEPIDEPRMVRKHFSEIPRTSPERLAELLAAMDGPIDTSEIPEQLDRRRILKRDKFGSVMSDGRKDLDDLSPEQRARAEEIRVREELAEEYRRTGTIEADGEPIDDGPVRPA